MKKFTHLNRLMIYVLIAVTWYWIVSLMTLTIPVFCRREMVKSMFFACWKTTGSNRGNIFASLCKNTNHFVNIVPRGLNSASVYVGIYIFTAWIDLISGGSRNWTLNRQDRCCLLYTSPHLYSWLGRLSIYHQCKLKKLKKLTLLESSFLMQSGREQNNCEN